MEISDRIYKKLTVVVFGRGAQNVDKEIYFKQRFLFLNMCLCVCVGVVFIAAVRSSGVRITLDLMLKIKTS